MSCSRCRALFSIVAAAALAAAPSVNAQQKVPPAAGRWWHDITVIADDSIHGRRTGTADYVEAAHYVASQFQAAGLAPGGTDGYLQTVHLAEARMVPESSSVLLETNGKSDSLPLRVRITPSSVSSTEGPMVFIGYGLALPGMHDDLAGVDLHGKVAVYLDRMPKGLDATLFAHGRAARWKELEQRGAVAGIAIADAPPPNANRRPAPPAGRPVMGLADDSLARGVLVTVDAGDAERLFAGSGHTYADMVKLADAGTPMPTVSLVPRLHVQLDVQRTPVDAPNVVGILRGSDAALRDQYLIVSAHLDHLGVGRPVNGDSIYNGAMDNASGIATLLETARAFNEHHVKPKRSVIFLAVTGEEEGELGSAYFALHPTVPSSGIVADLNTDMYLPIIPLTGVFAYGWNESDLGKDILPVLAAHHLKNLEDPEPEQVRFIRSDQYSFIQRGIPALAFKAGYTKDSPGDSTVSTWLTTRYHKPSDDVAQPVNFETAVAFDAMYFDIVRAVADRPTRPAWYPKSVFASIKRPGT
jgi:hypothetical protein